MHCVKVEVQKSQYVWERTSVFANIICCSTVDFSGAILVYTCRKFSPEYVGMRICNEVFMDEWQRERERVRAKAHAHVFRPDWLYGKKKEHYFKLTFIIFTREITVHFGPDPRTIMFLEQRLLFPWMRLFSVRMAKCNQIFHNKNIWCSHHILEQYSIISVRKTWGVLFFFYFILLMVTFSLKSKTKRNLFLDLWS